MIYIKNHPEARLSLSTKTDTMDKPVIKDMNLKYIKKCRKQELNFRLKDFINSVKIIY